MAGYAELELGLHCLEQRQYAVELRFVGARSKVEDRVELDRQNTVEINTDDLLISQVDPVEYGQKLQACLFKNTRIRDAFRRARAQADTDRTPLRMRLSIGPTAPELRGLLWETLRDPESDAAPLLTGDRLLFSRYLNASDWRAVLPRSRTELSALVVISNPGGLGQYQVDGQPLGAIDVQEEQAAAEVGLAGITITTLGTEKRATLATIVDSLSTGSDILYLVCHGAMRGADTDLWLEDESGNVALTSGSELVDRLRNLIELPRLAVLSSCQSAGTGYQSTPELARARSSLAARLMEIGIPAVLAMQGSVSVETMHAFMPRFFAELQTHGQVDLATARARQQIQDHDDAWMPALFMRLNDGEIWSRPDYLGGESANLYEGWPRLLQYIDERKCTIILGPSLADPLVGPRRELGRRWALRNKLNYLLNERDDLPQIAQLLAVHQHSADFPMENLPYLLRGELLERWDDRLPAEVDRTSTADVLRVIARIYLEEHADDSHHVLARLPFRTYVTTSPGYLLTEALRMAGRDPQVIICPWRQATGRKARGGAIPTDMNPLVYHALGRFDEPSSLVLSEDDYFEYLIGVTSKVGMLPPAVGAAVAGKGLIFSPDYSPAPGGNA